MKTNSKIIEKIKNKIKSATKIAAKITNMIAKKVKPAIKFIMDKDIINWCLMVFLLIDVVKCITKLEFNLKLQVNDVKLLLQTIISFLLAVGLLMQNKCIRSLRDNK